MLSKMEEGKHRVIDILKYEYANKRSISQPHRWLFLSICGVCHGGAWLSGIIFKEAFHFWVYGDDKMACDALVVLLHLGWNVI